MLAVALGWVGGNVDAIGFLILAQIFIAHMNSRTRDSGISHIWAFEQLRY